MECPAEKVQVQRARAGDERVAGDDVGGLRDVANRFRGPSGNHRLGDVVLRKPGVATLERCRRGPRHHEALVGDEHVLDLIGGVHRPIVGGCPQAVSIRVERHQERIAIPLGLGEQRLGGCGAADQ